MKGWVPMFLYLDSLIVLFFAVLSVLASHRAQLTPTTIQDFLALRVTVLNVVFLLIFALFRATFRTRLFGDRRLRGIGSQILNAFRRAAVMAAVLFIYLIARKATEPIVSVTKDYFCSMLF